MQKFSAYSAFIVWSAIRLFLASVIPMFGAFTNYLLLTGKLESLLMFEMSLSSVMGVFTICGMSVIFGIGVIFSLLKDDIVLDWRNLKDWYND